MLMMMMMMSLAVTGWVDLCLSIWRGDSDDWSRSPDPADRQKQRVAVSLMLVSGCQMP